MQLADMVEDAEVFNVAERQREEWLQKRLGKITCSQFTCLMKSGRAKDDVFSQTGKAYLRRIVAETLGSSYSISARAMDWGIENEPNAILEYGLRFCTFVDNKPFQYFAYNDRIGGTPDGLVGVDGCVEVKCPYDPSVHVNTLLSREVPEDYEWQVVGHMLVTGRDWCDFISYDPRMNGREKLCVIRVERSEPRITELKKNLDLAVEYVDEMLAKIRG